MKPFSNIQSTTTSVAVQHRSLQKMSFLCCASQCRHRVPSIFLQMGVPHSSSVLRGYCIKSCSSLSRGAAQATSFIVKLTQTSKQTNCRLCLFATHARHSIRYVLYWYMYVARVVGYQMCHWEPRGFFVKEFFMPPRLSSVGTYAHRS